VHSDCKTFNSAQWLYVPRNAFSGIEVQFLKTDSGKHLFLGVYSRQILSSSLTVEIENQYFRFEGTIMEGNQLMELPLQAAELIEEALLCSKCVKIYLQGFYQELLPNNFKLSKKNFYGKS
jgi:hypothetical protein